MTVPSTARRAGPFYGTGAAVNYPFTFKVFAKEDLEVTTAIVATGVETEEVLDSGYAVTLNVDQDATPGGYVRYAVGGVDTALPATLSLAITGEGLGYEQTADLPQGGNFDPTVLENALDNLEMQIQNLRDQVGRSLQLAVSTPVGVDATLPAPVANNFLGWDDSATALRNVDPSTLATIVAFASWQSQLFSGTGAQTVFTLSSDPGNINNLDIAISGVTQTPTVDYTLSGVTLTFATAPPVGVGNVLARWGQALPQGVALATDVSFTQAGTGALTRTVQSKLRDAVSVFDFIPVALQAAISAYTSTTDVSDYINAALAAHPAVYMPPGLYRCLRPINLSARRSAFGYWGRHLIGAGVNATVVDAYTGNYPCIDATGQNTGAIVGINFRSDNPPSGLSAADCASIGLMMGRGNVSTGCNQLVAVDLRFNLTSDMVRNAGNGTIGILNNGAEHIIRDQIQIYANLPLCDQNGLQFTPSYSSNIPTYGANYEQPYAGANVSCTIHESRNMQLIAWDSFRAMWLHQVAGASFSNLYTSTRKLVSSLPAQKETIYLTGSCANIFADCYQEVSGLFGATYRMDHRYLTFEGINDNINLTIQRGANDYGFTLPGAAEPSIVGLAVSSLNNSNINCNYTKGIYQASGDNNGFAALPITLTGALCALKNNRFTLDHSGSHNAAIFSAIGPYCTNVLSQNYYSGETMRNDVGNTFTPVVVGLTTAGVGTYTKQLGVFERSGGWCHATAWLAWSAHTGTGIMTVQGWPYTSDANMQFSGAVDFDGLVVAAGKQLSAVLAQGGKTVFLRACDPAGGAVATLSMDTVVGGLTITISYKVTD